MKMHFEFGTFGAILVSASSAGAQVGTVASTRVEASGQVLVVGDETNRVLISTGGATFSVSLRDDGQLALALAGASRAPDQASPAGISGPQEGPTGPREDHETVSLSIVEGDIGANGSSGGRDGHHRVVIANFN